MSLLKPILFCCNGKKCPVVQPLENGKFHIGSPEEGITEWDKDHLKDFVNAAKSGKFDELIKD